MLVQDILRLSILQ